MEFNNIMRKSVSLKLLSAPESNHKMVKNIKLDVLTFSLNFAHSDLSGYNVCAFAMPLINPPKNPSAKLSNCSALCVGGRNAWVRYEPVRKSRIRKTRMFFENRSLFMRWLISDIEKAIDFAIEQGKIISFRLNAYSDIKWENIPVIHNEIRYNNVFDIFPDIVFYDYSKNPKREQPNEYTQTYSYYGNEKDYKTAIKRGMNVAVVFEKLPENMQFRGLKVVDGDQTDLRTAENDGTGVIVGLKFKGSKAQLQEGIAEGFVVPRA